MLTLVFKDATYFLAGGPFVRREQPQPLPLHPHHDDLVGMDLITTLPSWWSPILPGFLLEQLTTGLSEKKFGPPTAGSQLQSNPATAAGNLSPPKHLLFPEVNNFLSTLLREQTSSIFCIKDERINV